MKRSFWFISMALCLILICAAACAQAAEIRPYAVDPDKADTQNGTFSIRILDTDKIDNGGYFSLELYQEYRYPAHDIEQLAAGDTVYVDRVPYTVAEVAVHEEKAVYEIYTEEEFDGYIVFRKEQDGRYAAVVNDWIPCAYVGTVKIMLPLPDAFIHRALTDEDDVLTPADEFIGEIAGAEELWYNQYNSSARFENGLLVEIITSDYPYGPEEAEGTLIYEFFGCDPETIRTAEIASVWYDCEGGPETREISEAEQESIRRLALHGKITGRANDTSVTGNTTIYTFTAPDGNWLMSLEFYRGLLVLNDGMYNYTEN